MRFGKEIHKSVDHSFTVLSQSLLTNKFFKFVLIVDGRRFRYRSEYFNVSTFALMNSGEASCKALATIVDTINAHNSKTKLKGYCRKAN